MNLPVGSSYTCLRLVFQERVGRRHGGPGAKVRWPLQAPRHIASQVGGQGRSPVVHPGRPHHLVAPTPGRLAGWQG